MRATETGGASPRRGRAQGPDTGRKPVPAVRNAVAILEHLRDGQNTPRSLTEIARATSINLSTCFNLLKTLEAARALRYDEVTRTYQLGPLLGELGRLVDDHASLLRPVVQEARVVKEHIGLGCFVMTFADDERFVVLDKVESDNPIRISIDIGASFPASGAVAAKAWFAWLDLAEVAPVLARHGLAATTSASIIDPEAFARELERTRASGYAQSIGEHYPDHNAVAAPVFGPDGRPRFLLVVVGTTSQLPAADMASAGATVRRSGVHATGRIGGRAPSPDLFAGRHKSGA